MKMHHRISIAILLIAVSAPALMSYPAQATEKGYRYWGYFQAKPGVNVWTEAQTGPSISMKDGSVEGWAFTFSGGSVSKAATPRTAPNFASICGKTDPVDKKKRVAIVVDFGNPLLAPKGELAPKSLARCVVLDKKAIGVDVLNKVVKVRSSSSGFVCGFNNYPRKECGIEIPTPLGLRVKK